MITCLLIMAYVYSAGSVLVIYRLKQAGSIHRLRFIRLTRTLTSWAGIVSANNLQMYLFSDKVCSESAKYYYDMWQKILFPGRVVY